MLHIIRNHTANALKHYDDLSEHLEFVVDFYSKIFTGITTSKARTKNAMSNLIYKTHKIKLHKSTFESLISIILKGNKVSDFYSQNAFEFISILKLFDKKTIKELIIGLPNNDPNDSFISTEIKVIDGIKSLAPHLLEVELGSNNLLMKNGLKNIITKIFDYEKFESNGFINSKLTENYSLHNILEKINLNSCPYCNRQFTFTLLSEVNGKRKVRTEKHIKPEIDHFYPQKYHPLLTISYYNLIPSCGTCNKAKSDTDIKPNHYIHPFLEGFDDDAIFYHLPLTYKQIKGYSSLGVVRLIVDTTDSAKESRINRNIELFKLDIIYQAHSEYASDIVKVNDEVGGSYLAQIRDMFVRKGLIKTDSELYKIAYSNYFKRHEFDKRILSKLTYDINIMADSEIS